MNFENKAINTKKGITKSGFGKNNRQRKINKGYPVRLPVKIRSPKGGLETNRQPRP